MQHMHRLIRKKKTVESGVKERGEKRSYILVLHGFDKDERFCWKDLK